MHDPDYSLGEQNPAADAEDATFLRGGDLNDAIKAAADEAFASDTPVVYFVQAGETGPIKIGFCAKYSRVRQRIDELQTGCPWPLVVRRIMLAPERRITEQELHEQFARYRLSGEWFGPTKPVAAMAGVPARRPDVSERLIQAAFDRGVAEGNRSADLSRRDLLVRDLKRLVEWHDDEDGAREERLRSYAERGDFEDLRRAA